MEKRPGAIIIGSDFQCLGVLRCLSGRGVPAFLLDHEWGIARYSRYKKVFIEAPDIKRESEYLEFFRRLADRKEMRGSVVFANNDATVYFLSRHREELAANFRVSTPPWEITKYLYDKKNTYQRAVELEIPAPKTYCPENSAALDQLEIQFPAIIKPAIRENFYSKKRVKAFKVHDRDELRTLYKVVNSIIPASEIMVQEFIPGGPEQLYSFCPLFKNGEVLASITAIRKRQHPMDFGHATTFAETVDIPLLQELSKKFLSSIHFYGLAEVEFMLDPRDQTFKLIEVNPRIWGWHTLAIGAGVPLPYFLYLDMIGEPFETLKSAEAMKWVRSITDVPTVFKEILKGNMSIKEYVDSMRGKKEFAVFSFRDPLPFFMEIIMIPYLWFKRGF